MTVCHNSYFQESPLEFLTMEEDSEAVIRRWEDLDTDILVKIFQRFSVFELTSGLAHVCSGWRVACCDPILWKTLDLSFMKSHFIKIPLEPYVYVERRSDETLTRVLKLSMNLSRGSTTTLIFHFNLFVSDEQLTYTAERSPCLKRLVLPAWNRIKKTGICKSIRIWKDLESLTMPSIANPPYLMAEIAKNCRNFTELKIMGPFEPFFANTLISLLPGLRVLSLRCSSINYDALLAILDGLPNLEVLNISHSYVVEPARGLTHQRRVVRELDSRIMEKAARLRKFLTCMELETCVMCQRTEMDEGIVRWYKYEEGQWKADEVSSLHLC
ncbi:PREDICTED: F-box/LRR-repeat protein At3g48880-like [Tarenaya hassleriana]|uniref:F-box/LRR-repeat protein At3g48880-like n=1 Tax=Tarenaya hassleriana TaxID=28532 RepID=UPI00053C6FF2|nr:PREDICTED: F-box/LRR-repeat protein At3g48880-like [Tarenaya hassleriana]XP_010554757.1 PREDICTED: F-box/LRR-repeat protein At3g48880-like [Tarenaya hassleriana]XP_010554758.1 PREDICTED: F-box/LRR-repeat protein At3g48880-like [Tarenaya hassleriana]XP_010554759.1 PREDICTED: F-box/LRR-repeat protein At3g48880-like [Tarenaya hassleriana]XP_010554760.1 PREDICTED: F-box/LRR-repeat protein At3g48880-like [Tarenaya hassleriana]XP_019059161.1 PREDICTED: F-box/LRR-repeat protein At3g48880-like [Tar